MPKFMYTILVLVALLWWGLLEFATSYAPQSWWLILAFLILFFTVLTLTLSIPFYLIFHKKAPDFTNLRFLYRKSLKWSGLISFLVTGVLSLRAGDLGTPINIGLFILLVFVVGTQLRK